MHSFDIFRCLLLSGRHLSSGSIVFCAIKQTFPVGRHEDEVGGFPLTIFSRNHCIKVERKQKVQDDVNYQHDDVVDGRKSSFGGQIVEL